LAILWIARLHPFLAIPRSAAAERGMEYQQEALVPARRRLAGDIKPNSKISVVDYRKNYISKGEVNGGSDTK
jgi:hypothetical protein